MSKKKIILMTTLLVAVAGLAGYSVNKELAKSKALEPIRWQEDIDKFTTQSVAEDAFILVGSSSFRLWSTMENDLAPIPVVNRGFGGSQLADISYYSHELVSQHKPRAILVFCGANDTTPTKTKTSAEVLAAYKKFVGKVRSEQPNLPIYYLSITPSELHWEVWPEKQAANSAIAHYIQADDNHYFVDVAEVLLGSDAKPNPALYRLDKLHLNQQGYERWTKIIKSRLLSDYPEFRR